MSHTTNYKPQQPEITFLKSVRGQTDTVIFTKFQNEALGNTGTTLDALDEKTGGLITHALQSQKNFKAKIGQTYAISLPKDAGYNKAIILGLGEEKSFNTLEAEKAGGKLLSALNSANANHASLFIENPLHTAHIATGLKLKSYKFEKYKTKPTDDEEEDASKSVLTSFDVIANAHEQIEKDFNRHNAAIEGAFFARNLVNEPPNHLYPDAFAQIVHSELKPLGIDVEIMDEAKMERLGMDAILSVGKGSSRPPRMVIMRWQGNGKHYAEEGALAFVGKGVTFDTGGISLKPGAGMDEMKMDMGGAAAVVGLMKSLAIRKAKVDAVGIIGLAENMPSSNAYRPGDIISSYAGKTIEVLNTDAEGRLVLADAIAYVQDKYKPKVLIDLATLTGAIMVALGHEYCGTFSNNDDLWDGLEKASARTGEKLWRMPLDKVWKKEMQSAVADLRNLGKTRNAGACTAAGFLEHFIKDGTPWAHMDIAGTAWIKADKPTAPKNGTGFGVRVLDAFVEDRYE